jgi:hypothetical protein
VLKIPFFVFRYIYDVSFTRAVGYLAHVAVLSFLVFLIPADDSLISRNMWPILYNLVCFE